ncbi:MAG: hydrogenase iron-sulfur subunit [Thermoplasmata archaeon]|nr:MAG: hydrogenase iron-sulfur subunit [Thermoplasmata archaeon]
MSAGTSTKSKSQSRSKTVDFEPKILAFCCNWCSYAGADLAGVSRFQYNPHARIIRVMCSGRIDLGLILNAFDKGADGVLVSGCHPGDCHYITGNEKAQVTMELAGELIQTLGLEPERLKLQWISAAEGQKFAESIDEFVETIKNLGESGAKAQAQGG